MVLPRLLLCLAALTGAASAQSMKFINPPPQNSEPNPANFPKFQQGSTVTVRWSKGQAGKAMSLTLWQLDQKTMQFFGDMEYLSQNFIDKDSYSWLVGTRKDLKKSNLFYFAIFKEGSAVSDSNSQYFNITLPPGDAQQTPTPSKANPSATTAAGVVTSSAPASDQGEVTQENGLSTGAKIGIGVAVPLVVLVGIAAGACLWFRRRRDRADGAAGQPMLGAGGAGGEGGMLEAGGKHNNINMSQLPGSPSDMTATTAVPPPETPGYWRGGGATAEGGEDAYKHMMGDYYQPPPVEMGPGSPQPTEMSAMAEPRKEVYEMPAPEPRSTVPR